MTLNTIVRGCRNQLILSCPGFVVSCVIPPSASSFMVCQELQHGEWSAHESTIWVHLHHDHQGASPRELRQVCPTIVGSYSRGNGQWCWTGITGDQSCEDPFPLVLVMEREHISKKKEKEKKVVIILSIQDSFFLFVMLKGVFLC